MATNRNNAPLPDAEKWNEIRADLTSEFKIERLFTLDSDKTYLLVCDPNVIPASSVTRVLERLKHLNITAMFVHDPERHPVRIYEHKKEI